MNHNVYIVIETKQRSKFLRFFTRCKYKTLTKIHLDVFEMNATLNEISFNGKHTNEHR